MNHFKEFNYKKFGLLQFDAAASAHCNDAAYQPFIKILFLKAGSSLHIDFKQYLLEQDALFFIMPRQWYQLDDCPANRGSLIYYNRDFYCIEIHDKEVACDGILYNNIYEVSYILLQPNESQAIAEIIDELALELQQDDSSLEEMLRLLLKKIIIKSVRLWKASRVPDAEENAEKQEDIEFMRKFSQLVELNYKQRHSVSDYADLLNITPKALTKRVSKYSKTTPNDVIKDRIILEAKRLLAHSDMHVKEISYALGYEDPAYFNRLFTKIADVAPAEFRRLYKTTA